MYYSYQQHWGVWYLGSIMEIDHYGYIVYTTNQIQWTYNRETRTEYKFEMHAYRWCIPAFHYFSWHNWRIYIRCKCANALFTAVFFTRFIITELNDNDIEITLIFLNFLKVHWKLLPFMSVLLEKIIIKLCSSLWRLIKDSCTKQFYHGEKVMIGFRKRRRFIM